ncbi:MAG TPA: cytochrome c biogenesis protein CcdA [Methanosarcinales archaeon]|nr:cytochrome c biogenesis protein CcdA [Methanosarcinales archaeon]
MAGYGYMKIAAVAIIAAFLVAPPNVGAANETVNIVLFFDPDCSHCEEADGVLEGLDGQLKGQVIISRYNSNTATGIEMMDGYGIVEIPSMVVQEKEIILYSDYRGNLSKLESLLLSSINKTLYEPEIDVHKEISPVKLNPGEEVTIKISVVNKKNITTDVFLIDQYPDFLVVKEGRPTWNGTLSPGEVKNITYAARVDPKTHSGNHRIEGAQITYIGADIEKKAVSNTVIIQIAVVLTLFTVFLAGLIAGANPCLFAVVAFMAAMILSNTGKKSEVIKFIFVFSSGVFLVYLLTGIGLLSFAGDFRSLNPVLGVITIALGILHIYDYVYIKTKAKSLFESSEMTKSAMERLIRKNSHLSALGLGALFSLVKAPCVGAIYLTILNLIAVQEEKLAGITFLFAYNFGVILPILIIGIAIVVGLSPKRVDQFRKDKRAQIRLITGIILVALGLFIL